MLGSSPLAADADGIALSRDGVTWLAGAGDYGQGWGEVGRGISVESGQTVYIKYYSRNRSGVALHYAAHGTRWGEWSTTGPKIAGPIGSERERPVILKLDHVGTTRSTVTWVNGSGTWSALTSAGVYDLALHDGSRWTLPPLTITASAESPRGWRALLGWTDRKEPAGDVRGFSVPDGGGTAALLAIGLLSLVVVWRLRARRARRHLVTGRT